MSCDLKHSESERLAGEAEALRARGDHPAAAEMYGRAAQAEEAALAAIDASRPRTRGITAVSALSLWHNAGTPADVLRLGTRLLSEPLPDFAQAQVREIIQAAQAPGAREGQFEVEITFRQTLRYAVSAANRTVAEREAVERWRSGNVDTGAVAEHCELVEVKSLSGPAARAEDGREGPIVPSSKRSP